MAENVGDVNKGPGSPTKAVVQRRAPQVGPLNGLCCINNELQWRAGWGDGLVKENVVKRARVADICLHLTCMSRWAPQLLTLTF